MDKKQFELRKIRIFLLFAVCLFNIPAWAQSVEFTHNHDEQKKLQWQSMENGPWGFKPQYYYSFFHKKYSGAKSIISKNFSEDRSDVKRVGPVREKQWLEVGYYADKSKTQLDKIDELTQEELIRQADRIVDFVYSKYEPFFKDLQECISSNLDYAYKKSNGYLYSTIEHIQDLNDQVCEQIEYIHKTGLDYQIESTKRQLAYEEARQQMEDLAVSSTRLAKFAALNFDAKTFDYKDYLTKNGQK